MTRTRFRRPAAEQQDSAGRSVTGFLTLLPNSGEPEKTRLLRCNEGATPESSRQFGKVSSSQDPVSFYATHPNDFKPECASPQNVVFQPDLRSVPISASHSGMRSLTQAEQALPIRATRTTRFIPTQHLSCSFLCPSTNMRELKDQQPLSDKMHFHLAHADAGIAPGLFNVATQKQNETYCGQAFLFDEEDIGLLHPLAVTYGYRNKLVFAQDAGQNALAARDRGVRTGRCTPE